MVRNAVFRLLRLIGGRNYEGALSALAVAVPDDSGEIKKWTVDDLNTALAPFYEGHTYIATDHQARDPRHLSIKVEADKWLLEQTITDPDQHNDWMIRLVVDLPLSKTSANVALGLVSLLPI